MTQVIKKFDGQRALVTGATQGIGKAVALRLARAGAHVGLNYARNHDIAQQTLSEFHAAGYSAELCCADIGASDQAAKMVEDFQKAGPISILVCNAAYQQKITFMETERSVLARTLEVNILGNFQLIQLVSKKMIEHAVPGRIVVGTSPHGTLIFPDAFAYDVSKAGLDHLIRCAALPLIKHGIRVNGVSIGWTVTPGERRFTTEKEQYEIAQEVIPIKRPAEADEIAAAIEFLCSDESSYAVGSIMLIDGGYCLAPSQGT